MMIARRALARQAPRIIRKIKNKPLDREIFDRANEKLKTIKVEDIYRNSPFSDIGKQARSELEQAQNGRPFAFNAEQNIQADVPSGFINESLSKIKQNSVPIDIKSDAIGSFGKLFKNSIKAKTHPDAYSNPSIEQVHRYVVPMEHGDNVYPTNFVVKEFKDGRQVLSDDILDFNKGRDLSLYNMRVNEKIPAENSIGGEVKVKDLLNNIKDTSGDYKLNRLNYLKSWVNDKLKKLGEMK